MSYLKWVVVACVAISASSALPLDTTDAEISAPIVLYVIEESAPIALDVSEVDTSQLPIPPVLQVIVQQVQSGNSVDTSNLPPFMTTFINQLQTGTLPPMLQSKKSFIN